MFFFLPGTGPRHPTAVCLVFCSFQPVSVYTDEQLPRNICYLRLFVQNTRIRTCYSAVRERVRH